MQSKNQHNEEFDLEKEAPFLSSISFKKSSFKIPRNYFDELPHTITEQIGSKPQWGLAKLKWAIPAFCVVLLGFLTLFSPEQTSKKQLFTDELYYALLENKQLLDLAIDFEASEINYKEIEAMEHTDFTYEIPVESENIDLNILFE